MGVDILMGARAACKTVGVTFGNGTREELTSNGADYIIADMAELKRIIETDGN
jgi:phosphoglycolate phosphatase